MFCIHLRLSQPCAGEVQEDALTGETAKPRSQQQAAR